MANISERTRNELDNIAHDFWYISVVLPTIKTDNDLLYLTQFFINTSDQFGDIIEQAETKHMENNTEQD